LPVNSFGKGSLIFRIIVYFFQGFGIPVSELDNSWHHGQHDEKVDNKDSTQQKSMSEELYFSVENNFEMLDVVVCLLSDLLVIQPLLPFQSYVGDDIENIQGQSYQGTRSLVVVSFEKGFNA